MRGGGNSLTGTIITIVIVMNFGGIVNLIKHKMNGKLLSNAAGHTFYFTGCAKSSEMENMWQSILYYEYIKVGHPNVSTRLIEESRICCEEQFAAANSPIWSMNDVILVSISMPNEIGVRTQITKERSICLDDSLITSKQV